MPPRGQLRIVFAIEKLKTGKSDIFYDKLDHLIYLIKEQNKEVEKCVNTMYNLKDTFDNTCVKLLKFLNFYNSFNMFNSIAGIFKTSLLRFMDNFEIPEEKLGFELPDDYLPRTFNFYNSDPTKDKNVDHSRYRLSFTFDGGINLMTNIPYVSVIKGARIYSIILFITGIVIQINL